LASQIQGALEMGELLQEQPDEDMAAEVATEATRCRARLEALEFQAMLSDEIDPNNCFVHIQPGAGGTESCDWAGMLLRLYTRWAERKKFQVKLTDLLEGDEAGITRAVLHIKGEFAFGYLKAESGIHRLVRISPFDSQKRRHTSFASVHVTPELDDTIEVEILDKDLRIDTFRSSGAGGQHVNVTDSAVRITHLPTGIVVSCQNERSQHQNREVAMQTLRSKLYLKAREEWEADAATKSGEKKEIGWGHQIRSYVFQPYQMVKDLRTGQETSNVQGVMDGEIDEFVLAFLRKNMGKG
jgi:peptide chain release factor 2